MKKPGGIAADRLRSFRDRIERLEEEKAGLTADIREDLRRGNGQEALLDVYRRAIGLD